MNQPLRMRPGMLYGLDDEGKIREFPGMTADVGFQQALSFLGQHPTDKGGIENDHVFKDYEKIPAIYPISVLLDGADNSVAAGSVPLRPEQFILKRITWCTTGDTPKFVAASSSGGSSQGRVVEIEWQDEFTKFLGSRKALISALFGDSNGFLDIPRGALFQGKQTLSVNLTRITWPDTTTPVQTRFDFCFQGLGLLPKGVHQSGTAG